MGRKREWDADYISRKVMDRYQDKMTIRLERLWKRIVALEGQMSKLLEGALEVTLYCHDGNCDCEEIQDTGHS